MKEDNDGAERNAHAPERDAQGRWTRGTCGNPKGRPRKTIAEDHADIFRFGNTLVEVNVGGRTQLMRRREANLNNLFARSMKGDTRAGIYLDRQWVAMDERRAAIFDKLRELEIRWYVNAKPDEEVPFEVETFIRAARQLLGLDETPEAQTEAFTRMREAEEALQERARKKAEKKG